MNRPPFKSLLIVLFLIIFFTLTPLIFLPLPYLGQDWLSYEFALAQSYRPTPTPTPRPSGSSSGQQDEPNQEPDAIASGQAKQAHDPETTDISVWFPQDAIDENIHLEIQLTSFAALPKGTRPLSQIVGVPFFFGAYIDGKGTTIKEFNESIIIFAKYNDGPLGPNSDETHLRMYIYNPAVEGWVKLCSRIDVHGNVVAGSLASPIPFKNTESSLLAISLDSTVPLEQAVDGRGITTISLPGSNFNFRVLPNTVKVGTHFEVTVLPEVLSSSPFVLLNQPVDIKACNLTYEDDENSRQVTNFPKPIEIEFDFTDQAAALAGGSESLTIAHLENETDWLDVQDAGLRVTSGKNQLSVDTDELGTFSLAVP